MLWIFLKKKLLSMEKKIVVLLDLFDLQNIYFILFSFILTASNDGTIVVTDLTNPSQPTLKHTLTGHKVGNKQILTRHIWLTMEPFKPLSGQR